MRRRLLPFVLLAGCTVSTRTEQQPIIGGTAADADTAVVLLVAYPSDHSTMFTCTAEVVSSTALLTAAHCVDHPGYSFGVFFDADASAYATLDALLPHLSAVGPVHLHPSYDRNAPFTADIAVAQLASPTAIAPLDFLRDAPVAGTPARIIGYGQIVPGQYNATRQQATTQVAAIDAGDTIQVGDAQHLTCVGDSGGPALVSEGGIEKIAGVDSYTDMPGCTQPAHFRRTDTYATFIDQYAGTMPPSTGPDAGVGSGSSGTPDAGIDDPGDGGGCATSGGAGLAVGVLALGLGRRRRRR